MNKIKKNDHFYLIDGSGYIFRAYYALPPMNNPDGIPINAVYGFTNMMVKLIEDFNPQDICVLFDFGRETFRNEIYANYKANRTSPPEDLIPQFDLIKKATTAIGLKSLEIENNTYGAIMCVGTFTFGHVKPPALDEFIRITKNKGLICFTINEGIHEEYGFDKKIEELKNQNKY